MSKSPMYDKMRRTSRALGQVKSTRADIKILSAQRREEFEARCSDCSKGFIYIRTPLGVKLGSRICQTCGGTGKKPVE